MLEKVLILASWGLFFFKKQCEGMTGRQEWTVPGLNSLGLTSVQKRGKAAFGNRRRPKRADSVPRCKHANNSVKLAKILPGEFSAFFVLGGSA